MRVPLRYVLGAAGVFAMACNNSNANQVTILESPDSLNSVSLNQAVELYWSDNPFLDAPSSFYLYRVYSTSYNLDTGFCGTTWALEGTTVAPEFLVGALTNGVPHCYGVTSLSSDGGESARSPLRQDTPRPDARNILIYAYGTNPDSSAFRFWDDVNGDGVGQPNELGLVGSGNDGSNDFVIDRNDADSSLWIVPLYTGDSLIFLGSVDDLTSIDYAPASGYSRDSVQLYPEDGYVFQKRDPSGLHYGAVRITHVGREYVILDWSVQTDPGNPELKLMGGRPVARLTSSIVRPAP